MNDSTQITPARALLWSAAIFQAIRGQKIDVYIHHLCEAGMYIADNGWLTLDRQHQEERNARDAHEWALRREREKVTA